MKARLIFLCLFLAFALAADDSSTGGVSTENDYTKQHKSGTMFAAFGKSFSSIVVSEIGDKTFFIAAIMAMRYNRVAVLAGALLALFLMTAISSAFGTIVPTLLPPSVTHILITVLFFFFGGKLLYDAYNEDGGENDEQAEVEIELNQLHSKLMKNAASSNPRQEVQIEYISNEKQPLSKKQDKNGDIESSAMPAKRSGRNCATRVEEVASKLVFWQALTMTFLGEWGDRSQISTIALAAESNAYFVFLGGFLGHCLCTGMAVIGGKFLAKKISERTVNICGGVLFLIFGIHNLFLRD